jgi:phosphate-selective porin OprO/OprP
VPSSSALDATRSDAQKEEGENKSPSEVDVRWKEGLHLGYHYKDIFSLELGGLLSVDGGYIDANQVLENAYPTLQEWTGVLRYARFNLVATFYKTIEAKIEYDFANQDQVNIHPQFLDLWIASKKKIPVFGYITVGNMKEPFSLEELTSSATITFMERSLPTNIFSPSYNWGSKLNNTALHERINWAAGIYWNTQNLNNVYKGGDLKDQFNTANGYSLAARVTGLPWYEEGGKRLLHLGVSYNFRARNLNKNGGEEKFSTRPESYLTDEKLVDTGSIAATRSNLINGELAWVWGPFSLQGEYFHAFTNGQGNPNFWGYYIYASFFLTGEYRSYDTSKGVFTSIKPKQNFNPFKGGWGAWEIAARYSRINLNSHGIYGGKEENVTIALNWYLHPNLRLMFNYIRVNADNSTVDDGRANIFQSRFQVAF